MGAIYLGRRVSASHRGTALDGQAADVVLKQLLPEHTADPKLIEMFLREARLTASLDHPNIVRTLDLVNAGEDYFMVLEYVRGGDLRSLLRRAKRRHAKLTVASALYVVTEILAALDYAHNKAAPNGTPLGLIHRDVSPSNILLGSNGEVKLTDFGIAKAPTQGSVVFKVKGKVGYMAPEQARGEPVDPRTDLFAVGVVLYELLTAERLFVGNALSPAAVIFAQPIRAPSRKRPEVSSDLDQIVLRALSLDREARFSSASEFQSALLRLAEHTRRELGMDALAEDLRRACGEDSAHWLSLDVPAHATLDGGGTSIEGPDVTGVILTDEDSDEFNDRPPSLRAPLPPAKELTSVIPVGDEEFDLTTTTVAPDPFARTHLAAPAGAPRRATPRPPAPEPQRAPRRLESMAPRATFSAPVPRSSPPPPEPREAPLAADQPTRITDSGRLAISARNEARPSSSAPSTPAATRTTGPATATPGRAPVSLTPGLNRSKVTTTIFTVGLIMLLIALGIGVGALLSGSSPEFSP